MEKVIYRPFVKDGELWGIEVNPLGDRLTSEEIEIYQRRWPKITSIYQRAWQEYEQSIKSFKVDESCESFMNLGLYHHQNLLRFTEPFTADLNDKQELINLQAI